MSNTINETTAAFSVVMLLSCVAISAATSMAVHLYFQAASTGTSLDEKRLTNPEKRSVEVSESMKSTPIKVVATKPMVVGLQALDEASVPSALRLDAYFSPERRAAFGHTNLFKGCTNVFAVVDAIHPYLVKFFEESAWMQASDENAHITTLHTSDKSLGQDSDDENDDDDDSNGRHHLSSYRRTRSHWRLPQFVDPSENTEIAIYPGVDPRTFAPDKIINLDTSNRSSRLLSSPKKPISPSRSDYYRSRSSFSESDESSARTPKRQLVVLPGAQILGGTFDLSEGSIYIGKRVRIEPNVYLKGPAIIGDGSTVRSGAYIRGDVIVGRHVVLRGELKNTLIMDRAELCHPGYCGDSVCGYKSHFGNQVTTANLNLFSNVVSSNIIVDVENVRYDSGRKKIGVILGDMGQLGCSTVTDPCTLIQQNTVVYPLTRLRKGIYGPNVIIKNKPMEKGVLEIVPIQRV